MVKLLPSGKPTKNYGKSPFLMGKSTISMVIFNSYFDITRGYVNCSMSEFTEVAEFTVTLVKKCVPKTCQCPTDECSRHPGGSGSFVSSLQLRTRTSQNLPEPPRTSQNLPEPPRTRALSSRFGGVVLLNIHNAPPSVVSVCKCSICWYTGFVSTAFGNI